MKLSLNWLNDYIDLSGIAAGFSQLLSAAHSVFSQRSAILHLRLSSSLSVSVLPIWTMKAGMNLA